MMTPKSKQSSDSNRRLLELEVKNSIRRVTELTATVDQLKLELATTSINLEQYEELGDIVSQLEIQVEELTIENTKNQTRIEFQNSESEILRTTIKIQGEALEDLRDRLRLLERRFDLRRENNLNLTPVYGNPRFEPITEVNWPPVN